MDNILGVVKIVFGSVTVISANGIQRIVREGDTLLAGDEIVTGNDGSISISLDDGKNLELGRNSHWSLAHGVQNTDSAAATAAEDVTAMQQAIADGMDPTQALEATAAGEQLPLDAVENGMHRHGGLLLELTGKTINLELPEPHEQFVDIQHTDADSSDGMLRAATAKLPPEASLDTLSAINITTQTQAVLSGTSNQKTVNLLLIDSHGGQITVNNIPVVGGKWSTTLDVSSLAEGTLHVDVTTTDVWGQTATASGTTLLDITPPELTVQMDTLVGDEVVNHAESLHDTTEISGTVGGDAKVGDPITVTVNGQQTSGQVVTLANGELGYQLQVNTADVLANPQVSVSVTTSDAAGNSTTVIEQKTLQIDLAADASITLDTLAGDDVVNHAESLNATTTISGTVGGDAKVGDAVSVTVNGQLTSGQVIVLENGELGYQIPVSTADVLANPQISVSVTTTDAAGNTATASEEKTLQIDLAADASITLDTLAGDDVVNHAESLTATTTISGTVGGDAKVGDAVSVAVNGQLTSGQVIVLDNGELGYQIPVSTADVLANQNISVSITTTDAAGNTATASEQKTLQIDLAADASITLDTLAGDDVVNHAESLNATTTISGTVGGDAKVGDAVTVTVNGQQVNGSVIALDNGELGYQIPVSTTDVLANPQITVSITTTDAAGNVATASEQKTLLIDLAADASITLDTLAGDDVVNHAESLNATTTISGTVGGDAKVGDAVSVTVNGQLTSGQVIVLDNGDLGYQIPVSTADVLANPQISVSVTTTDAAGNVATASEQKTLQIDLAADASMTLDTLAGDDVVNHAESLNATTTISGTVGGDAKVGDPVSVTVNGQQTHGSVIALDNGELGYQIPVSTADVLANQNISVSITTTDAAGNVATASEQKTLHIDLAADASITLDTLAGDDVLNHAESLNATTTISGTVGGDAKVGDPVTVTVNGQQVSGSVIALDSGELGYQIPVSTADILANPQLTVSVTTTDAAGNTATASEQKTLHIDLAADASITLDTLAGDDVINHAESLNTTTTISGTVGGDAKVGDPVTVTVNGQQVSGNVIALDSGDLGYQIPVSTADVLANPNISVSITTTDAAGNTATANEQKTLHIDLAADASITLDSITGDDVVNAVESTQETTVISGSVGGDAKVGDAVTVTVNGQQTSGQVVTLENGTLGYQIPVSTADIMANPQIGVSITTTDAAGNVATASEQKTLAIDLVAETHIDIGVIATDDIINIVESQRGETLIQGVVGGDAKAGDPVIVTVNGQQTNGQVIVLESGELGYQIPVNTADMVTAQHVTVSITSTDAAGNIATATAERAISTDLSASTSLTVDTVAGDDVINHEESLTANTLISGSVGGDAKPGDVVEIHVNGKTITGAVSELADGQYGYQINVPSGDLVKTPTFTVSITSTDSAGNVSHASEEKTVRIDTVAEAKITVNSITADNVINASESTHAQTAVTGNVSGDVKVGDTVTLSVNGKEWQGVVEQQGNKLVYSIDVDTVDLMAGKKVIASITGHDDAGNLQTVTATKTLTVDLQADAGITMNTVAGDNMLNAAEMAKGSTVVSGLVSGDVKAGDTVRVTVNGHTVETTVAKQAHLNNALGYSLSVSTDGLAQDPHIQVEVTGTDRAGNTKTVTAEQTVVVDTQAEASITIAPITGDNMINGSEIKNAFTEVSGHVDGDARPGDRVSLQVNGQQLTGTVETQPDGSLGYRIAVSTADLVSDPHVKVIITATDEAGNTVTTQAEQTVVIDTRLEAAVTIDTVAQDNVLNADEVQEAFTTIGGKVTGEVHLNDNVVVTIGQETFVCPVVELADGKLGYQLSVPTDMLVGSPHIHASLTSTDAAGNTATVSASRDVTIDTHADAGITIHTVAGDNVLNAAEMQQESVTLSGRVTGDAKPGDSVTVEINGKTWVTEVVTLPHLDNAAGYLLQVPTADLAANPQITVSVTASDAAGNTTTASSTTTLVIDEQAEATITLNPVTGDNIINHAEAGQSFTVISGVVGGDVSAGDRVQITVNGNTLSAAVVTLPDGQHGFQAAVSTADLLNDPHVQVQVTTTDSAGNTATAQAETTVDIDLRAQATIALDNVTLDGVINAEEHQQPLTTVSGRVSGDVKVGDTVTIQLNGVAHTTTVVAHTTTVVADSHGQLRFSIDLPTDRFSASTRIVATVTGTDDAGNSQTVSASKTVVVDTEAHAQITINTTAGDNVLNAHELGQPNVMVNGTVSGDVKAGDTVTVTVNGHDYVTTVIPVGNSLGYQVAVSSADMAADPRIEATVQGADHAGNHSQAQASQSLTVDTEAEASITLDPVAHHNVLDAQALKQVWTTVSGQVSGDARPGDTVTVSVNGHTLTTQVEQHTDGSLGYSLNVSTADLAMDPHLAVAVTTTDAAGNTATASTSTPLELAPGVNGGSGEPSGESHLTIHPVTGDDVVNAHELEGGTIVITGSASGHLAAGETVLVTVNGNQFTAQLAPHPHLPGEFIWQAKVPAEVMQGGQHIVATLEQTPSEPAQTASPIVQVNGGSGVEGGFDVSDGKIVKLGPNTRVWLTEGDVKPQCDHPDQVRYYSQGNAGGESGYADVFVVHSHSGYHYHQSDWSADQNQLKGLDSVHGNSHSQSQSGGKDYLFIQQEPGFSYEVTADTNNRNGNVNTLDGVKITFTDAEGHTGSLIAQGSNQLEGVLLSDGSALKLADTHSTSLVTTDSTAPAGDHDAGANVSAEHAYTLDTEVDTHITINEVTGDNLINQSEGASGWVNVSGHVSGEAHVGDTVALQVNGQTIEGRVEVQADGSLGWTIAVSTTDLAADPHLSATLTTTDAAGNVGTATAEKSVTVDLQAEASITIHTIAGDNTLNGEEVAQAQTLVSGDVGGDVHAGDTVTLTVNGQQYQGDVVARADGSLGYEIAVSTQDLQAGRGITASVIGSDAAGNSQQATAHQSVSVDTQAQASIKLDVIAGDDTLNGDELSRAKTTISGELGGDVKVGDIVTVTVNGQQFTTQAIELPHRDGQLGFRTQVDTAQLQQDPQIKVTLTTSDAAGNAATATVEKTLTIDAAAQANVAIDAIAGDDIINGVEAQHGQVIVQGSASGDVVAGNKVHLTVNGHTLVGTLVEENGELRWAIPVSTVDLQQDPHLVVQAVGHDAAGNAFTAQAEKTVLVDTHADVWVAVDSVTADNVINAQEAGQATLALSGRVGGDVKAGETVTLTVNGKAVQVTIEDSPSGLVFHTDVATADLLANPHFSVEVSGQDLAGNTAHATAQHSVGVDLHAEATVTINTLAGDNVLNAAEAQKPTTTVSGTVAGDVHIGDSVQVVVNGQTLETPVIALPFRNGVLGYQLEVNTSDLMADPHVKVSVTGVDAAGNSQLATVEQTLTIDTEAVASITLDPVTGDDILNNAEAQKPFTTVSGTVSGDVKAGSIVTLTVNDQQVPVKVIALASGALGFTTQISTADLLASPHITAAVTGSDAAGNTVTVSTESTIVVDRVAEVGITLDSVTSDNVLNGEESQQAKTWVTGHVTGDAKPGDVVTLKVQGETVRGVVEILPDGSTGFSVEVTTAKLLASSSITASITATDVAGNSASASASHTVQIDTHADAGITLMPVAGDNIINHQESQQAQTWLDGAVSGDAKVGDAVTVNVNGVTVMGQVETLADGSLGYHIPVATSDLLADATVVVSVTASDAAGNSVTVSETRQVAIDTQADASITLDAVAGDNIITNDESQQALTWLDGAVSGDAKAGDAVTVNVNGATVIGHVETLADGSLGYHIPVATSDLLAGSTVVVSITASDAAGNSVTVSETRDVLNGTTLEQQITVNHPPHADGDTDIAIQAGISTATTGSSHTVASVHSTTELASAHTDQPSNGVSSQTVSASLHDSSAGSLDAFTQTSVAAAHHDESALAQPATVHLETLLDESQDVFSSHDLATDPLAALPQTSVAVDHHGDLTLPADGATIVAGDVHLETLLGDTQDVFTATLPLETSGESASASWHPTGETLELQAFSAKGETLDLSDLASEIHSTDDLSQYIPTAPAETGSAAIPAMEAYSPTETYHGGESQSHLLDSLLVKSDTPTW